MELLITRHLHQKYLFECTYENCLLTVTGRGHPVFPFHAPLVICTLYFVIEFVHKTPYNGNTLLYKVNGKIKGADYKWCMKRKHPHYDPVA